MVKGFFWNIWAEVFPVLKDYDLSVILGVGFPHQGFRWQHGAILQLIPRSVILSIKYFIHINLEIYPSSHRIITSLFYTQANIIVLMQLIAASLKKYIISTVTYLFN